MAGSIFHINIWLLGITFLMSSAVQANENEVPARNFAGPGISPSIRLLGHGDTEDGIDTISFTRAGNLILIRGVADTTEGNFILDTGAPNLVLNITYFRDYPTTYIPDAEQTSITGSTPTLSKTKLERLVVGNQQYHRVEADLANLGHIENSKGVKILGLLGLDLFRQYEMVIDYERNQIYLQRIARKKSSSYRNVQLKDESAYTVVPIELMDNRIVATIMLGGRKLKFVIDCAAESNVLSSKLPDQVFEYVSITGRTMLGGASNTKVEALKGNMKGLKIGGHDFATLPVVVTNLEKTCFAYAGCIDGVLGFDFLVLHKIGFNFVTRKMYIWK